MKGFHKFLGVTALLLTVILILTLSFTGYYISRHKEILTQFQNIHFPTVTNVQYDWSLFNSQKSSTFETLTTSKTNNFDLPETIVIDVSLETIEFVEEDRTDILVEYYNEYPNSPLYKAEYFPELIDSTLYIRTNYKITDLFIDKKYDSKITLHVPKDYICKNLDITLSMGELNDKSIYKNASNLKLTAKLGDIDVNITTPKDTLIVNSEAGNIDLEISAPVSIFESKSNYGETKLDFNEKVGSLFCELDMGNLTVRTEKPIDIASLSAKMGNIEANFSENVEKLTASAEMGNVEMVFGNNNDSTVYIDTDMGNINSDFELVKENDHPDFKVYSNMGNVSLDKN